VVETLLAALFGLLIGSFLNVCIYRWPLELSVIRPRSACVECKKPIAWYDNVPVVSYVLLRGRCRHCGTRIHWRYPVVEVLTAIAFMYFVHHSGVSLLAAKYCVLSAMLITLVFTDLETLILPDEFTIGGFFVGLVFAWFTGVPDDTFRLIAGLMGWLPGPHVAALCEALFGGLLPAVVLWLGGWLFEKIRHKEGLGLGDVKMLAMVGAFLGIHGTLLTVIGGAVAGSFIGLAFIKLTGKDPSTYALPFGSFLGAAGLAVAIYVLRIDSGVPGRLLYP